MDVEVKRIMNDLCYNYTIFYYVFDEENIVKVVKVAYSKMDFDKMLKKFDEEENRI